MQQNISASLDIGARPFFCLFVFPDNQHARKALSLRTATMSTIYRNIIRFGFGQSPFVIEDQKSCAIDSAGKVDSVVVMIWALTRADETPRPVSVPAVSLAGSIRKSACVKSPNLPPFMCRLFKDSQ